MEECVKQIRQLLKESIKNRLSEGTKKTDNVIAILPGRFQPFHRGHYKAYRELVQSSNAGVENTYIVTTNPKKLDPKDPLPFSAKKYIMKTMFGIPEQNIIEARGPANPYFTRHNKPEPKPSEWMAEIISKSGFDIDDFALVVGYGEDDIQQRASNLETVTSVPKNVFWSGLPYKFQLPRTMSGTKSREVLKNPNMDVEKKFKAIFNAGVNQKVYSILQKALGVDSPEQLNEGGQFGFVKHIEDLSAEQLLDFLKLFGAHDKGLVVNEKVDGHFYKFGLKDGKFFTLDQGGERLSKDDYPDLYFFDDFREFYEVLSQIDFSSILKELGFKNTQNFLIESESIPFYNHNAIVYDPKIIKDGIIVMFNIEIDDKKIKIDKGDGLSDKLASALSKPTKIKFFANPRPDTDHIEIPQKFIIDLEALIRDKGNILNSKSRKRVDVAARKHVKELVSTIGQKVKGHVLKADFDKAFGNETEGLIFYTPKGDMVKIVDKDLFLKRKKDFWKFIDAMSTANAKFKRTVKKDPSQLKMALADFKAVVDSSEKDFLQNPNQVTNEKKREDTYRDIELRKNTIEKIERLLKSKGEEAVVDAIQNRLLNESTGQADSLNRDDVTKLLKMVKEMVLQFNEHLKNNTELEPIPDEVISKYITPHGSGHNVSVGKQDIAGDLDFNFPVPSEDSQPYRKELKQFIQSGQNKNVDSENTNGIRSFFKVNGKTAEVEFFYTTVQFARWSQARGRAEPGFKGAFIGKIYSTISDLLGVNLQWNGARVKLNDTGEIVGSRKKGTWKTISDNPDTMFQDIVEFFTGEDVKLEISGIPSEDVRIRTLLKGVVGMVKSLAEHDGLPDGMSYDEFMSSFKSTYDVYLDKFAELKGSESVTNQMNTIKGYSDSILKEVGEHTAVSNNSALNNEYFKPTIENLLSNIGFEDVDFIKVGSVKPYSGDVDVGIDTKKVLQKLGVEPAEDIKKTNALLFSKLKEYFANSELDVNIQPGLSQISVSTPVFDQKGNPQPAIDETGKVISDEPAIIQVDLMFGNPKFMKKALSGAPHDSKYKASFRNELLIAIFGVIKEETDDPDITNRWTINFKHGFQTGIEKPKFGKKGQKLKAKEKIYHAIEDNADKISEFLFDGDVTWDDINSFEKLANKLKSDEFKYKALLPDIKEKYSEIIGRRKTPTEVPSELN